MKTDMSAWRNRSPAAMMAVLSLSVAACGGSAVDSEASTQQSRAQRLDGEITDEAGLPPPTASTEAQAEGHGRSAPAVLVDWAGSPQTAGVALRRLTVRIVNTTPEKIETDVSVSMPTPGAAERTHQALGRASLESNAPVDIPLDVAGLPVQTAGVATALQVVVTYEGSVDVTPPSGSVSKAQRPINTTYSPTLFVTHTDDFQSATIRSEEDEAQRNGELLRTAGLPTLTGMKINGASVTSEVLARSPVERLVALPEDFFPPPPQRASTAASTEESAP